MEIISGIVVGLITGWLAGLVMEASAYAVIRDVIVGTGGGLLGGWIASIYLQVDSVVNVITPESVLVAFAASALMIFLLHVVASRRRKVVI